MYVRPSVTLFLISILSVSLVALREKLKRDDPNYFSILGMGIWVGFPETDRGGVGGVGRGIKKISLKTQKCPFLNLPKQLV